jgi:hypothetical protein
VILQLYRAELATTSLRLSPEEQEALIALARNGDRDAKERLLRSLLNNIFAKALVSAPCDDDLAMELTSVGNCALMECLDRLIHRDYPLARVTAYAYGEMRHYQLHCRGLITLPHGPNIFHFKWCDVSDVLNIPMTHEQMMCDTEVLYEAVDALPENARNLIVALFGLYGHPQLSMSDLAGGLNSTTKDYQAIKGRKLYAFKLLREKLPQPSRLHTRKARPDYADLELPEWCQLRMDEAARKLQAAGEMLSMKKLRQEARVHTRYASAYLYQLQHQSQNYGGA